MFLLGGCATANRTLSPPVGELHNGGVKYVLEHLERNLTRAEAASRIVVLAPDYCERVLHTTRGSCTVYIPEDQVDAELLIGRMRASAPFKDSLRRVVSAVDAAQTLPDLDQRLVTVESQARSSLSRTENRHLSDAISIARSSARLWAPVDQGGLNGGGIVLPADISADFRFPWKKLLKDDLIGCLGGLLAGACLGGAVVGTAIGVVEVLLEESS